MSTATFKIWRGDANGGEFQDYTTEVTEGMGVLDAVNAKWGRNTLRPGRIPTAPDWGMRREMMSQSFTTRMDQLWEVGCR